MKYSEDIIKRALELFNMKLSTREISRTLKIEYNINVSHKSIFNWVKKFIPNPIFLINGSHKPECNQAISIGVKRYFERKKMNH